MSKTQRHAELVVGIDLGGTNMQLGVVDRRQRIIGRSRRKTKARRGAAAVVERIVGGVERACQDADVELADIGVVGIVAPGAIDIPRGVVLEAPNLKWVDFPLRATLEKALGRRVVLDNDVNGAVWGEFQLGAARPATTRTANRGPDDVLGVWVGTGVGGGLVIGSRIFHGEFFTAGEIGQTVLFPAGVKGRRTLEDFGSRTGMARTIKIELRANPRRRSLLREILGPTLTVTGSEQLARAYRRRDALAVEVIHRAADLLGLAIANCVTVLAIDTVIVGGGVTEALGAPFLRRITASFRKHVFPARSRACRLVMTQLKDDAGLLGAALLAQAALQQRSSI